MKLTRRAFVWGLPLSRPLFLPGWTSQVSRSTNLQVEVMEVFLSADGPCALLVHHANEATRDEFSRWIRANSGARVECQLPNGTRVDTRIFRVSQCFGRGLLLTRARVAVKAKDILSIVR